MQQEPELTIVIPAYNEAAIIEETLRQVAEFVDRLGQPVEVIVVDDGSTDATAELARGAIQRYGLQGRVISLEHNQGKGAAVRRGMLEARGRLVLFSDADLSTPLDEYFKLRKAIEDGADVAIASRAVKGAVLQPRQPLWRQTLGQLFALVRRLIVLPGVRDTQCGFKLFKREVAQQAFSRQRTAKWAFDAEVLFIADRLGYRIAELPVRWRNRPESRVRVLRDMWHVLADLAAIRWYHRDLRPEQRQEQ